MKIRCNRWKLLLSLIILCTALLPATAEAGVKYSTFTKDSNGNLIWLQPAYYPIGVIGQDLSVPDPGNSAQRIKSPLQTPKDIFIDPHNDIYIADTGNNRIVHMNEQGQLIRYITVPESPLLKPEGVFVTVEGDIYIADTGNKRVIKLDKTGKLQQEYKRPDSRYIPDTFVYDPSKVMVDERGFLYVAVHGGYEGLVLLDGSGKFQGFFGANKTVLSALDALKRWLYTKEMYANEIAKKPETINSVATDKNGYIYTVTGGTIKTDQLKKLNIKGENLLRSSQKEFGEYRPMDTALLQANVVTMPQLIDVAVDQNGNMIVVDQQYKYISHYDSSGNLLYFWGGPSAVGSSQVGLIKSPVALDVNSRNELFVLDDQENIVQVFRLSEFGEKVNQANLQTLAGYYEASEKPWQDVLRMNAQFTPAILGLAKAAYKKENFESAEKLFKEAGDHEGYSDSFWQIRMRWFQKNFSWIASIVFFGTIALVVLDRLTAKSRFRLKWKNRPRWKWSFILHLKHALYILKHPVDGFTAVRYEGKGSYAAALLIMIGVYGALLFKEFFTSFSFNMAVRVDVYSIFTQFFIVWITWIIANYLVSSIYRGEGRFRDILIGSAYALVPYIIIGVPLALISNVMTLSESSIYNFIANAMLVWIGLLMFWKIQWVHNYSVGETVMNVFLTLCTMLVIGVLIFITAGLTNDLASLFYEMFQEVLLR
ncbi:Serine/threonine-protein kinase PknD [Paenibacillus konkukensis]|uniref:Serine/threonine-protein kinase PknD n=1 Tax=Paenibacillus konkukensis TaxID=2020716 RepID=A0ABY4RHG3_9BACL|nr:YIP1 family protein [Paenibacillus konkukensis]UQZ81807.1 Serine/threonine-protein kinase PknD [Paenibacillus konkukensis]